MSLLKQSVEEYEYKIHGFCIMTNHVHIALQVGEIPISKIMHNINFKYAKWVNRLQNRVGHVFQGRFKSIYVGSKSQLLELVRYIHLNPVRAKIAEFPDNYEWSSHCAYLGRRHYNWLTTDFVLNELNSNNKIAIEQYKKFMCLTVHRKAEAMLGYKNAIPLRDFFAYSEKPFDGKNKSDLADIIKFICDEYAVTENDLVGRSRDRRISHARGIVAWLARELEISTVSCCARAFNRDVAGLSRVIERVAGKVENLRVMNKFILRQEISQK